MLGYYNNPGATASVLKDGWLYTGDIGKKDEDGYIYILDRKKDMIIVNGMNVYPREVEEVICRHPAVAEANVVGEKDEMHGEIPVAIVVLKEGAAADEHVVRKFCREHIANYKVPHRVEFWKELPKNSTGKVMKREIRKMMESRKTQV
jgi:long-chain acyl-CoA synthetase